MGQEHMASWRRLIFAPIPLLETRPPERWHCTPTLPYQATSHKIKSSSPTPESSMCRHQTPRISRYNIGPQPGPSSQCPCKIARRPVTTSFNLHLFRQKRRVHASALTTLYRTRYPSDALRRLLPISLPWICRCQRHRHRQPLQDIIPCQNYLSNPRRHSLR